MKKVQKVLQGRCSIKKVMEMMEKLEIHRPMIVGMEPLVGMLLRRVPVLVNAPVFSDFHANPDLKDAEPGAKLFREQQCDGLVSIGGGSSIDTAKAIKCFLNAEGVDAIQANRYPETMTVPHLAIPGTAGTGSEATQIAVAYLEGRKLSLNHPDLRPDGVILDADLLDSLPDYQKKSCAMDALAQGIESYWSRASNDDSRVHAYLAILGVLDNLKAYLAGDKHAAEEILEASFQSGKAIQMTRTTAAHAMSYQLTKMMGLAHGHACMVTLPVLWSMMEEKEEMKPILSGLAGMMRLGDSMMGPKLLRGIMLEIGLNIPTMPNGDVLDELARSVNAERLANHPVKMTTDEIREAYRQAFVPLCDAEKQMCIDLWKYYG